MRTCSAVVLFSLLMTIPAGAAGAPSIDVARDHFERAMLRSALADLGAILDAEPDSAAAWALLCRCRIAADDVPGAVQAAVKAATLDPDVPEHWLLLGRSLILGGIAASQAGQPKGRVDAWMRDAEAKFRHYQQLVPEDPEPVWRIGQAREWQGNAGEARQFYELAIDRFPGLADGYCRLAQMLMNQAARARDTGETKRLTVEAIDVIETGLGEAGDDGELLCLLGLAREAAGEPKAALEIYLRSLRGDPEYEPAWVRAAKLTDPERVLLPVSIWVLGECPSAAEAAWWAGRLTNLRAPGEGEKPWAKHREALGYLLPALEAHGDHDGLYTEAFRAAQVLLGKDPLSAPDPKVGTDAFARIHDAYRWSGDAANNLGFFYREAGKYALSLDWYLKSVARAPENQDILNDTGLIYLFHVPAGKEKGLPYFLKTVALVTEGDQKPERGYWDALENLCKHYWEVDRQPEKVVEYARMRYVTTKGVPPYNMSGKAKAHADLARKALGR